MEKIEITNRFAFMPDVDVSKRGVRIAQEFTPIRWGRVVTVRGFYLRDGKIVERGTVTYRWFSRAEWLLFLRHLLHLDRRGPIRLALIENTSYGERAA